MLTTFVLKSENSKTGPIPTTLTEQKSCPSSCPFKHTKSCYPFASPVGFSWQSIDRGGFTTTGKRRSYPMSFEELCEKIETLPEGQLWRHNVAGDLPGENEVIDVNLLHKLVLANKNAKAHGFTYTHKPIGFSGYKLVNGTAIYAANQNGFTINLSANSLQHADELYDYNIGPVVVVLPSDSEDKQKTPKGRTVISCPAEKNDNVQCANCKMCYKVNRKYIIGFHSHGKRKLLVNQIVQNNFTKE